MGYAKALEAAGAKIVAFQTFGSYQGDWLALVVYKGKLGMVQGYFGSCSGCDAFEAEFNYSSEPYEQNGKYYDSYEEISKDEFDRAMNLYNSKLAHFGLGYLEPDGTLYDKAHYEHKLSQSNPDDWFSQEEAEYCRWAIEQFNLATAKN